MEAEAHILDSVTTGLSFGDSPEDSRVKLESRCGEIREVVVQPPSFPLADDRELHLICHEIRIQGEMVRSLALTYADDGLVMLYAEGNASEVFLGFASEPSQQYLHFSASFEDLLVVDRADDQVWVMSADAAHPNLFQWSNPYISGSTEINYESSAKVPSVLRFSQSLEELQPLFDEHCRFSQLGTDEVWLLSQPEIQQQVDCFGYEFAGFPRKIEAVFGDGVLEQAWILTGKEEENRVRQALVAEYGDPMLVNEQWEVFHDNQVMLRKDKPEVLMLSARLARLYREKVIDAR